MKIPLLQQITRTYITQKSQEFSMHDPMKEEGAELFQPPSFGGTPEPGDADDLDRESLVHAARKKKR